MSKLLISYSGTTLKQIDLAIARDLAVKKAKKKAKGKPVNEKKVFEAIALKKTECLALRPNSTEEVSQDELNAIEARLGKAQFARFVQVHEDAPETPRSKRPNEPKKKTEKKPNTPTTTLTTKPGKSTSGKGAV